MKNSLERTTRISMTWLFAFAAVLLLVSHSRFTQAADSTSFNPIPVPVVAKSMGGGVPVGSVMAWPVSKNPDDMDKWLECNGQSISQSVYPELYAVVGGSVPDFRGLFLRGVGGNSAGLGVYQGDEIKSHNHDVPGQDNGWSSGYAAVDDTGDRIGGYIPTTFSGGTENRPVNKAVRYLIRAKP